MPNEDITWEITENKFISFIKIHRNTSSYPAVAFQGSVNFIHITMTLENIVCTWLNFLMDALIPFFGMFKTVFFKQLGKWLPFFCTVGLLGFSPLSYDAYKAHESTFQTLLAPQNQRIILTGHIFGGFMAKLYADSFETYAVAFESPRYIDSLMDASSFLLFPFRYNNSYNMINIFSESSIFSFPEEDINANLQLPQSQTFYRPVNPYKTFCLLASGCTIDDKFDSLCEGMISKSLYLEYFSAWKRKRFDLETSE